MPRSYLLIIAVLLAPFLAAVDAVEARGQEGGQEEALPREFVEVFLQPGAYSSLVVGELHEEVARWVTPPADARVVGSVVRGPMITTALAVPSSAQAAIDEWMARLQAAGWRPAGERAFMQPRGFLPATDPWPAPLCLEDESMMNVRATPAPAGGSYLLFTYRPSDEMNTICAPPDRRVLSMTVEMPALRAPEGTRSRPGGAGGGPDEGRSGTRVSGDLSAAQLSRHYGAQMSEQGWTRTHEGAGQDVVITLWRGTNEQGERLDAMLAVYPAADGDLFAQLAVHRATARR